MNLTSYPARFPTLAFTLESILAQSVRPDHIRLWIAETDVAALPEDVLRLCDAGIEIYTCENLRSYKKIIPALQRGESGFILIVDDDVFYPRDWLARITDSYRPNTRTVVCGRAHRMRLDTRKLPIPYVQWDWDIGASEASPLVFPTGIGGVLYEPGIFHEDVIRADLFQTLCPDADDVWLYWMASLNGAQFRKVGPRKRMVEWVGSQKGSLFSKNAKDNDARIANMIAHYGFPCTLASIVSC